MRGPGAGRRTRTGAGKSIACPHGDVAGQLGPPGRQRLTINASGIPELANSNFGTIVESASGTPINVESAIYWNANGVTWEGGGNTVATRLP